MNTSADGCEFKVFASGGRKITGAMILKFPFEPLWQKSNCLQEIDSVSFVSVEGAGLVIVTGGVPSIGAAGAGCSVCSS
jgi:hypothetical protein